MPELACPQCRQPLQVPESLLGRMVACGRCHHKFEAALPVNLPEPGPASSARPRWVDRPRPRLPSPWDRDKDGNWPTPAMLDCVPLPEGGPRLIDDLGKPLASLRLFDLRRGIWVGLGIGAIVLGLLIGVGAVLLTQQVGPQAGTSPGLVLGTLGVVGVGAGFILLAIGAATVPLRLWVCADGVVWQRGKLICAAEWDEVEEVRSTVKRTVYVQRRFVGKDRVLNEVEVREYALAIQGHPEPLEVKFTTKDTTYAKPFVDVLEYEALRGRLPLELERLDRGEVVRLGEFTLDQQGVTHEDHGHLPWEELSDMAVRRNELRLSDPDERWLTVGVDTLPFGRLLFILLSMGMPVQRPPSAEDDNPFAF